jgi:hypothetical protein
MTTVAVEQQQGVDLEQAIEQLDERIGKQRLEVFEWEEKGKSASKFLAELRAQHTELCAEAVLGKASQGAVNKVAAQILDVGNKLIGIEKIVSLKRTELSELQSALQPLHAEQSRLARARAINEERIATLELISSTEEALASLNASAQRLAAGLNELRAKQYIDEGNRRIAFDSAQGLQRQSLGMRP